MKLSICTECFDINRVIPPIDLLDAHGVKVHFGCDGFYDSWSPYGTGDVLEKVTRYCELTRKIDEKSLRNALKWVTGGVVALNEDGKKFGQKFKMMQVLYSLMQLRPLKWLLENRKNV